MHHFLRPRMNMAPADGATGGATEVPVAPAAPAAPAAAPSSPPPPRDGEGRFVSRDQYDRVVGETRAEAAASRQEARRLREEKEAAEKAAAEARDAAAKAAAKAETEVTTVRSALGERLIDKELRLAAHQAGLQDLDLLALVKRDGLSIDKDGEVVGVAEAIAAFKTSKPSYFKSDAPPPPPAPTASGSAVAPAPDSNPVASNVRSLSAQDYAAAKAKMKLKLSRK